MGPPSHVAMGDKHSLSSRDAKGTQIWETDSAGRSISDPIICVAPDEMLSRAHFFSLRNRNKALCLDDGIL